MPDQRHELHHKICNLRYELRLLDECLFGSGKIQEVLYLMIRRL